MWKTNLVILVLCAANYAFAQPQLQPVIYPNPVPLGPQPVVPHYPTAIPQPTPWPPSAADNPASKNMHLMEAAAHLEAAGLDDEAKRIREMISSENSTPVLVEISMIEVSLDKLKKLGFTIEKLVPNSPADVAITGQASSVKQDDLTGGVKTNSGFGILKKDDQYFSFLKALDKDGVAKTLATPNIIAASGHEACLKTRGHEPIAIKKNITPEEFEKLKSALENINNAGTTIHVTPTVLDDQIIQVEVNYSISELDEKNATNIAGTSVPGLHTTNINTRCIIKDGYVAVLSGPSSKESTLIAIIKAEIVKPMQTAAKPPKGLLE
jgi:Flp pilus assembly secretin CpaC